MDGDDIILDIAAPVEIFGEMSLLGEDSSSTVAQAVNDSLICSIGKDIFFGFFTTHKSWPSRCSSWSA